MDVLPFLRRGYPTDRYTRSQKLSVVQKTVAGLRLGVYEVTDDFIHVSLSFRNPPLSEPLVCRSETLHDPSACSELVNAQSLIFFERIVDAEWKEDALGVKVIVPPPTWDFGLKLTLPPCQCPVVFRASSTNFSAQYFFQRK